MPTASPSALPGIRAVGRFISSSSSLASTGVPSAARASPRWKRAQAIVSAALAEIPPAGFPDRGIPHGRAT
jgi:hypothetical protein